MGYIRARGKSGRLYVTFRFQGKHEEPTKYTCEKSGEKNCNCRNCKIARGFLAEIEGAIASKSFRYQDFFPDSKYLAKLGVVNTAPDVTFSSYAKTWLDYQESVLSFSTHRTYKNVLNQVFKYFNNIRLQDIKPSHIKAYITSMDSSPKTIQNHIGIIKVIMNSAIDDEIITSNPCSKVKLPKVIKIKPDPFSHDEVVKILNWLELNNPSMVAYFAIAFYTGMRTGEIMGLKWTDINFSDYTITVQRTLTHGRIKKSTKTGKNRKIDIIETLEPYLIKHKEFTYNKSEYVIISQHNKPFNSYHNIVKYHFFPALHALGFKERQLYQTRHTFAVMMIKAGEDFAWIRDMLGHVDLKQLLERYGNWVNNSSGRKGQKFHLLAGSS